MTLQMAATDLHTRSSRRPFEKGTITVFRQPSGTRKMRLMNAVCQLGLGGGINPEDDPGYLCRRRSCRGSVEQAQIGPEMCAVIVGQFRVCRGRVGKG